jgi:hypothetical protein
VEGSLAWAPTLDRRPVNRINRREVVHARHDRPTFYRSPDDAIAAPLERLAYVEAFDPAGRAKDAMTVLDCDPSSPDDGQAVGWSELASSLRMGGCRALGHRAPGLPALGTSQAAGHVAPREGCIHNHDRHNRTRRLNDSLEA